MKRFCALLLTAALLTTPAAAAGEAEEGAQPALDLSAASAVLMEKETGTLLYEKESHEKLEPASVTKIMTLLLIFEALDSGRITKEDVVTVSAYAAGMGGLPGLPEGGGADDGGRAGEVHHRGLGQRCRRGHGGVPGGQ